ncbi:hypothetical protein BHQ18_04010 [Mycolicibacterium flavescens]|uniref:Glycoside hydrolase family 5 domain-containing protein n=1 Tax=Mycolicibacterium flavescens TaxID=1776 RepID=A0A1E3RQ34_MYCFV|nr:hypothetical protein BHQ18_04010 [Mycolicibacterium flavescens]
MLCAYVTNLLVPTEPLPRPVSYSYVPAAVIENSNDTIGIADSDIYGLTTPDGGIDYDAIDRHLEEMQKLGVNTVRVLIPWADIQPVPPGTLPPDWEESLWNRSDYIINAAHERGMAVLGVLNTTPNWGDDPNEPGFGIYTPPDPELYAAWAATVAEEYKGMVSAYEIWNEPNYVAYWTAGPDPEHYTEILKAAYEAIKDVDAEALVVAGVLGTVQDSSLTMNPVTFVERMYAAGAKGFFDALSIHPYNNEIKFSDGLDPDNLWQTPVEQLIAIRQQMIDNGDDALKIWATEYGLSTYIKDQETQAAWVKDFLDYWGAQDYTGPAFLFTLRDRLNDISEEGTMGIFTYEWGRKLVADVIECATTGRKCAVEPDPDPVDPITGLVQAIAAVLQQVYNVVAQTVTQLANAVVNLVADALRNLFGGLTNPATATLDVPAETRIALADAVTVAAEDVTGEPLSSVEALDNPVAEEAPEVTPEPAEVVPAPAEEVPAEEVPAEVLPEPTPVTEPTEELPVEEVPVEEVPVEEVPAPVVEETPAPVEPEEPAPADEDEELPAEDEEAPAEDEEAPAEDEETTDNDDASDDGASDEDTRTDTKDGNKATPGTGGAGNGAGTGSPGSGGASDPGSAGDAGGTGPGGADAGGADAGGAGSGGDDGSGGGDKSGGGSNVSYVQGPWGMILVV